MLRGVRPVTLGRNKGNRAVVAFGQQFQTAVSPTYSGGSWHVAFMVDVPYVAVRAVIRNQESAAYTLNNLAFAPSTNVTTPISTGSPVAVTFNGATSVTIPARTAANRPSITYSDWANVAGVVASSGTGLYPFHSRCYIATAPFSFSGGSTTLAQWNESAANALIKNRYVLCAVAAGDYVSSNYAGYTGYDATTSLTPIIEFEFAAQTNVLTVCGVGDSIMWGGGGSLDMVGAGHLACATISTAAQPVFWQNASVPSTTTTQFVTRLRDMLIAGARPQVGIYQSFSRNDGTPTAATIAVNRGNLYQALDLYAQYGVVPIIETGTAETTAAWNSTADNLRKGWRDEVISLCASRGITLINSDSVLSDQATPARYITSMTTDGTHPNDAGQEAQRPLYQAAIQSAYPQIF